MIRRFLRAALGPPPPYDDPGFAAGLVRGTAAFLALAGLTVVALCLLFALWRAAVVLVGEC